MLIVRPEITEGFALVGQAIQEIPILKAVDQVRRLVVRLVDRKFKNNYFLSQYLNQ